MTPELQKKNVNIEIQLYLKLCFYKECQLQLFKLNASSLSILLVFQLISFIFSTLFNFCIKLPNKVISINLQSVESQIHFLHQSTYNSSSCFISFLTAVVILNHIQDLQSQTKYLEQSKEILYNWTGLENFDIYFCVFLDLLPKFNIRKGDWTLCYISSNIYFLIFLNFLKF